MAANSLAAVVPQLLAQGLLALREFCVMPQLVNRKYEAMAGPQGSTIDVPIPSAIAAIAVTPGATPPATEGVSPTSVPIELTRWFEAPFYLDDQEMLEIQDGTIPMIASEAVKSLANEVDQFIHSLTSMFYGVQGATGTAPFGSGDTTDAAGIRTVLNKQVAPMDPRHCVLDPDAEGSALNVRAFQDMSWNGSVQGIIEGALNRKLGFNWWMSQNVQSHTAGTGDSYAVDNTGGYAIGVKLLNLDTGTGTLVIGDVISFSGHSQTYVVTQAIAAANQIVGIEPGLLVAVADDVVVLCPGDSGGYDTHVMNPAFHRDAIAFATRPLQASNHPGSIIASNFDPVSGLTLRLEITREHKRDRWSFDILYGAAVIRRELGGRLLG